MRLDKKAHSGQHRLILMHGMGRAFIAENIPESVIAESIDACRNGENLT
jgi:hypothetical protein